MNNIIDLLKKGKVLAIPTDTVYGLVCDATNKDAINKIYKIKNRDKNKAISIFVKDIVDVHKYAVDFDDNIINIMRQYWPGALTIIFKKKRNVLPNINPGKNTIGIRIPKNDFLLNILKSINFPLAQTSCNISGENPYFDSKIISDKFRDRIDYIVPGVLDEHAVSSTVIDVSTGNIEIIRQGDIVVKERFQS